MRASCHSLDRLDVTFDDERLVANAGLMQPATLAQHLGLRELFDEHVDLGDAAGRANVGHKAMTIIHSALAGGDSIDDGDALRAGDTEAVLGHGVRAPSTLGTFLRSFSWGHARQLDRVAGELLDPGVGGGGRPGDAPVTIDVDSSIHETYGLAKTGRVQVHLQPGPRLSPGVRGGGRHRRRGALPPARRQRQLRAGSGRVPDRDVQPGAPAGASGPLILRADSGFYTGAVAAACRKAGVPSPSPPRSRRSTTAIAAIDERLGRDPLLPGRRRCGRDHLPALREGPAAVASSCAGSAPPPAPSSPCSSSSPTTRS